MSKKSDNLSRAALLDSDEAGVADRGLSDSFSDVADWFSSTVSGAMVTGAGSGAALINSVVFDGAIEIFMVKGFLVIDNDEVEAVGNVD